MDSTKNSFFSDLLTMDELLILFKNQYSKHTIYRWIQREDMPHIKIKGKLWFSQKDICSWIQKGCH